MNFANDLLFRTNMEITLLNLKPPWLVGVGSFPQKEWKSDSLTFGPESFTPTDARLLQSHAPIRLLETVIQSAVQPIRHVQAFKPELVFLPPSYFTVAFRVLLCLFPIFSLQLPRPVHTKI